MSTVSFGKLAEKLALRYLHRLGYDFISKNVYTNRGELDLVFKDNATLVFVEVKAKSSTHFGLPEHALTKRKLKRFSTEAYFYVQKMGISCDFRLDAICIVLNKEPLKIVRLTHYKSLGV